MCMIKKRDGREVQFNRQLIKNAVLKAINNTGENLDEITKQNIADKVADYVDASKEQLSVEDIQDQVIFKLKDLGYNDISKAYSNYRKQRTILRERNSTLMKEIEKKITASNIENQNANVDEHSFGGRKGEADAILMKNIALNHVVSKKSRENHINNRIYIHDLDSYVIGMSNCLSIPFDGLLANGFNTRQSDIRPARSINTAFQLLAVIFQIQSLQQFGGVSATHLDWTLVPYVRISFKKHLKDGFKYIAPGDDEIQKVLDSDEEIGFEYRGLKENYPRIYQYAYDMTERDTYQAAEAMYHNLNTLQSRSGKKYS